MINYSYCFKPLSFGIVWYSVIDNSKKNWYWAWSPVTTNTLRYTALALGLDGGQRRERCKETVGGGWRIREEAVNKGWRNCKNNTSWRLERQWGNYYWGLGKRKSKYVVAEQWANLIAVVTWKRRSTRWTYKFLYGVFQAEHWKCQLVSTDNNIW